MFEKNNPNLKKELKKTNKQDTDFSSKNLKNSCWIWGKLNGLNLNNANMERANLTFATITNIDFSKTNLKHATFMNAILTKVTLTNLDLSHCNFENTILIQTCLKGANLKYANLRNTTLNKVDLRDAFLYKADLTLAQLKEIQINAQTLINIINDAIQDTQTTSNNTTFALINKLIPYLDNDKEKKSFVDFLNKLITCDNKNSDIKDKKTSLEFQNDLKKIKKNYLAMKQKQLYN